MMAEWSLIAGMVWVFSIILKIIGLRAERSFGSNGGRVFQLLIMHSQGVFCCREYQGIWLQCNKPRDNNDRKQYERIPRDDQDECFLRLSVAQEKYLNQQHVDLIITAPGSLNTLVIVGTRLKIAEK